MKAYCYSYTRSFDIDYRDVVKPSMVSTETSEEIRGLIRAVLDSDYVDLNIPKWILLKKNGCMLWGVCCLNELLSGSAVVDCKGRTIRGFFGYYVPDAVNLSNMSVTFDLNFFRELYKKYIEPVLTSQSRETSSDNILELGALPLSIHAEYNSECSKLNVSPFLCKSLGNVDKGKAVAAALTFDDISLLVDNDTLEQALDGDNSGKNKYPYMNCISAHVPEKVVKVKRKCSCCGRLVDSYAFDDVCLECTNKLNQEENVDDDMENKLIVENLNREVRDKQFLIEDLKKQLDQKKRTIKILWIVCGVLLIGLMLLGERALSGYHHFEFFSKAEVAKSVSLADNSSVDRPEADVLVIENNKFDIDASGSETIMVKWNSKSKPIINPPKVDWIKVVEEGDKYLIVKVDENQSEAKRFAQLCLSHKGSNHNIEFSQKSKGE